ncbi:dihydropteroate synthase [Actinomarinicola tropica]|uniref:Dihydropteroate synthase n=1 Tax=Actinomarinicola tropica TaxID=2789776 RepID=A0A5Q2RPJ2_9ACTN|nr:dihydropteroate synthase [Actinomarinicola tropica]QGG96501.1 dihydropteroate synthase [Actinomarinicola tropica]
MSDRPLVMGIVNVTPDSFSDGGRFLDQQAAIEHGLQLVAEGADLVDVGGESTRPGADPVDEATELERSIPVVAALAPHVRVSIDTVKPAVARAAVDAGATLVNDVGGGLLDVAAELGVGWVAMHSRGTPATMQTLTDYDDVLGEVTDHLVAAADRARAAGVPEVWIDPGIGFAKTREQNLTLLAGLDRLVATGHPVLVGTSRKAFLGHLTGESDRRGRAHGAAACRPGVALDARPVAASGPAPVEDRVDASVATVAWAVAKGARMVRVHDVRASVHAVTVVAG